MHDLSDAGTPIQATPETDVQDVIVVQLVSYMIPYFLVHFGFCREGPFSLRLFCWLLYEQKFNPFSLTNSGNDGSNSQSRGAGAALGGGRRS